MVEGEASKPPVEGAERRGAAPILLVSVAVTGLLTWRYGWMLGLLAGSLLLAFNGGHVHGLRGWRRFVPAAIVIVIVSLVFAAERVG